MTRARNNFAKQRKRIEALTLQLEECKARLSAEVKDLARRFGAVPFWLDGTVYSFTYANGHGFRLKASPTAKVRINLSKDDLAPLKREKASLSQTEEALEMAKVKGRQLAERVIITHGVVPISIEGVIYDPGWSHGKPTLNRRRTIAV
jgi:hypothetical protein